MVIPTTMLTTTIYDSIFFIMISNFSRCYNNYRVIVAKVVYFLCIHNNPTALTDKIYNSELIIYDSEECIHSVAVIPMICLNAA